MLPVSLLGTLTSDPPGFVVDKKRVRFLLGIPRSATTKREEDILAANSE